MANQNITIVAYGSYGSVRGYGPLYARRDRAEAALRADKRSCRASGGYSDRELVAVDDEGICYAIGEDDELGGWVPGPGGRSSGAARYTAEDLAEVSP